MIDVEGVRAPILLLLGLLVPSVLHAQRAGTLPRVLELPASTRAMALGDAYMMNARQSDVIFYHPALLTEAGGFGLEYQRWGGESSSTAASAAVGWLGGGVGIGLLTLEYGAAGRGEAAAPAAQDDLFAPGTEQASERVAVVGYARELLGFRVGLAGKLVEDRVGAVRETVVLADASLSRTVGPLTLGATLRELGEEPIIGRGDVSPSRLVLGAGSYGRELWIFDVGATAAAGLTEHEARFSGGVEIGYWPIRGRTFLARVGIQERPPGSDLGVMSFGLAYWGDDLVLEWAFRPHGGASHGTHRFGVRWQ